VSGPQPYVPSSRLRCAACGAAPAVDDAFPARCPRAGTDDADHVLVRELDTARVRFDRGGSAQPFVRFRELLHSYARARTGGMSDGEFVAMVESLDAAVAAVDRGFVATPYEASPGVAAALGMPTGAVWIKNETGNVAGSHKARHLFGLLLHLEVSERLGLTTRAESDRRGLAIASCGNAALAAATIAHAAGRPLRVFIPADANPRVVEQLHALGATIAVCERQAGVAGDPCVHGFRAALEQGALPFCVQGNENGLTIEGGMTLGWELAADIAAAGAVPQRLFVQIGGGALASAVAQALEEARELGVIASLPRLQCVQTHGCYPLRRAYVRVRGDALELLGVAHALAVEDDSMDAELAERLQSPDAREAIRKALEHARANRSQYMWPWESAPHSVAHGILDDETYDWYAVVAGMLASGGWPVTADEATLLEARELAQGPAGIRADATGAAALAGLVTLRRSGRVGADERASVLVTGCERD
jgi:threonine synthase